MNKTDSANEEIVKLKKIIEQHKQSKIKLKVLMLQITKKLEEKISLLIIENQKLKHTK